MCPVGEVQITVPSGNLLGYRSSNGLGGYGASDCIHLMTRPRTKSRPSASDIGFSGTDEGSGCRSGWADRLNNDRRFFVAQPRSCIFFSLTERRIISNVLYRSDHPSDDVDRVMIPNALARSGRDRARAKRSGQGDGPGKPMLPSGSVTVTIAVLPRTSNVAAKGKIIVDPPSVYLPLSSTGRKSGLWTRANPLIREGLEVEQVAF